MSSQGPSKLATLLIALVAVAAGYLIAVYSPLGPGRGNTDESPTHAMSEEATSTELYTCGMHPDVVLDEPGSCPICGMDLVPLVMDEMDASAHSGHGHESEGSEALHTCPMHPNILQDEPGSCPICGMDLVPVKTETDGSSEGTAVRIDPTVVQNMNVRTARAERRDLAHEIRTVGYLDYDQERMVTVTTKYSGFIETAYVVHLGEKVRKGQKLFEVYSPELVQTEEELLSALRFSQEMANAPEDARRRAQSLVAAARTRLGYWDISQDQIDRLEATGEVFRTLTVFAPASGLIMKTMKGLEGMAIRPGMELYHIADLSSLWLSVEVFEDQMQWVVENTPAEITLSYLPGKTFQGTVRYLEPELSEKTRTLSVRIEVPNPGGRLRKGMYATVDFAPTAVENGIVVPTAAVLRTGQRSVIIVAQGEGRFVPRDVEIGHTVEGFTEVISGITEGEEVVVSSQFLLDSESKLREAIQKMIDGARGDHAGHGI